MPISGIGADRPVRISKNARLRLHALRQGVRRHRKVDARFWNAVRRLPQRPRDGLKVAVYREGNSSLLLTYRNVEGLAIADRDMVLGPFESIEAQQALLRGEGPVGATFALVTPVLGQRWPNGIVYYDYIDGFEAEDEVEAAIAEYERLTPVDFRRRTSQANYIMFVNQLTFPYLSSMSPVGMQGGRQDIKIQTRDKSDPAQLKDPELTQRSALHEIGHSLGLKHEHVRPDRDQWVLVDDDCIDFWYGISGNYTIASDFVPYGPYDFLSIMHYGTREGVKGPPWDQQPCFDMVKQADKRDQGDNSGLIRSSFSLSRDDVNALHHLYGRSGRTPLEGDKFGRALLAHDFDGDGYDDVAVGAPSRRVSGQSGVGTVFVYKGTASGFVLWKILTPDTVIAGQGFGTALAAGDFDNDGVQDLAVGAPDAPESGKLSAGAVYLYSIRGNRDAEQYFRLTKPVPPSGAQIEQLDRFGHALAAGRFNMVSVDETGRSHLAIGAPGGRYMAAGRTGVVWIFDLGKLQHARLVDPNTMDLIAFGGVGYRLATVTEAQPGLTNTVDKLAIAAPGFTWLDCQRTPLYVARASGDGVRMLQALTRPEPTPLDGYCPHDSDLQPVLDFYPEVWQFNFGAGIASGDFDGDGDQDLAVGAHFGPADAPAGKGGRAYVFEQAADTGLFTLQHLVSQVGLDVDNPLDGFGWSLTAADMNADGLDDLAVGAVSDVDEASGLTVGRAFLFEGCVEGSAAACPGSLRGWTTFGQPPPPGSDGRFGFGASVAIGDFNGDGAMDLAVGAPLKPVANGPTAGVVMQLRGDQQTQPEFWPSVTLTSRHESAFERP